MDERAIKILIAEHLAVPVGDVSDTARFRHDLGADSLDMVQLSMMLEIRLGVALHDEEVERCLTVSDALRLLHQKCVLEPVDELYA